MKIKTMYKLGGVILGAFVLLNFGVYVDARFDGALNAGNISEVCSINDSGIDCGDKGITSIEIGTFDNYTYIQYLYLYDNAITHIDRGVFSGLVNLEELDLYNNKISDIESGSFEDLSSLRDLWLAYNQLTSINKGVFRGLVNLERLDISGNPHLSEVDYSDFEDMWIEPEIWDGKLTADNVNNYCYYDKNEESLDCSWYGIVSIESGTFSNYSNIKSLNLSKNQITTIEKGTFEGLNNLENLDLRGNPLESVDYSDFEDMGIEPEIDDGILTKSNFDSYCEIVINPEIDKKVMVCEGITSIVSGTFSENIDLRAIEFNESYLSSLDVSLFEGLDNLELIVMVNNAYKFDTSNLENRGIDVYWLGEEFDGELNAFNIQDVCSINGGEEGMNIDCGLKEIKSIKNGTFKLLSTLMGVTNIKELYLNDNEITTIEKGTFEGLDSLEYLYLRGNPLESVDYSDFDDMDDKPTIIDGTLSKYSVEEMCQFDVYMGKNTIMCMGITSVASGSFDDYEDVQMIGFVGGYLKSLDASLFEGLDDLEFIMVQDNYYELDLSGIEEMGIVVFVGELNNKNVNYVCGIDGDIINCNGRGITRVASGAFLGLLPTLQSPATIIHLDNNDMETLEDGAFGGINGEIPTYIDLQNNEIDEINLGAFEGINGGFNVGEYQYGDNILEGWVNVSYLNGLEEGEEFDMTEYYGFDRYVAIDLGDNEIEEIEEGSFSGLSNLQSINLESNNLSELDESVFEGLENLQELNIGDNSFECIPEWIYNSDMKIEYDDLKVCGLLDYETIQGLCNLSEDRETLDCSDKGITYLDSSAFDYDVLQGVKNVILSGNRISELNGEEFENLPSLEYANLRGNPLYCYPNLNEYFGYEEGDERDIELEADEGVPMCKELNAENMMKLCDIILPGYLLEQYGPSEDVTYDENSNDFVIDCSNRGITSIAPYTFENLNMDGESNYIYLSGNLIRELPMGLFVDYKMYSYGNNVIDLSDNKLENIDCDIFDSLSMYGEYNYLYLNNNDINNICDKGAFNNMQMTAGYFNGIFLNNNKLLKINQGAFANLYMISPSNHIYLDGNNISNLADGAFYGLVMQSQPECSLQIDDGGGGSDIR